LTSLAVHCAHLKARCSQTKSLSRFAQEDLASATAVFDLLFGRSATPISTLPFSRSVMQITAARHVRQTLKPDGSWMIVEPAAGDRLEDNLNPVSRMYYAASTMICVPTSLDQPVRAALGAQAGFAKLSSTITQGGFGKVRKAIETPFNMILEARP
jgi:hypothetical protein